ncbi:DUF7344 domain-containing protein [Haloarcula litorea]|uniref:DUF7344 domain-containing protein n=1 Tax=Haloarcula litorea TaxID=3032579 RepID=UPI0023E7F068|nr:hypothetical protein [Halomicroarcula sp. GDY20]
MDQNNTSLSRDRVFDILSSPRRRYVLYFLRQESSPIQLTELAEHVAAWENDTTVEELSTQQRKRVYVSLYQTHLPKLADSGLVDYDEDSGEVAIARKASEIDRYLGEEPDSPAWYRYYLALAVLSLVFIVASAAGLVQAAVVAPVVVGAFVLLTVVHAVFRWRNDSSPMEFEE